MADEPKPLTVKELDALRRYVTFGSSARPEAEALFDRIVARASIAPQPVVGAGWKLVPVVPTEDMLDSGDRAMEETAEMMPDCPADPRSCWDAMLSAAPQPSPQGVEAEELARTVVMPILWKGEQYNGVGPDFANYRIGATWDMGGRVEEYERKALEITQAILAALPSKEGAGS